MAPTLALGRDKTRDFRGYKIEKHENSPEVFDPWNT